MGTIKKMYGLPIMDLKNFSTLLRAQKIAGFRKRGRVVLLEKYLKMGLTEKEKKDLRFAPRAEVVKFRSPDGNDFVGFRNAQKDGVLVFALLPNDLLPICAEFRHGCEKVMLNLPSGLIELGDKNPQTAAKREFKEEVGIALKNLAPLNSRGVPIDARSSTRKNFFFLGIPTDPLRIKKPRMEKAEFIARFLIRVDHWLALMELGIVDDCSITGTLLALKKLNKLNFI